MSSIPYNLDEGAEYFEFIIQKNLYRFRYPSTAEVKELGDLTSSDDNVKKFLLKFISKVEEIAPDFVEVIDNMNVNQIKRFQQMVMKEMGVDENNSNPKGT